MNKKFFGATLIAALAITASWNYQQNENKIEMIATDGEVYISTFKGYSLNTVNQEEKICTM